MVAICLARGMSRQVVIWVSVSVGPGEQAPATAAGQLEIRACVPFDGATCSASQPWTLYHKQNLKLCTSAGGPGQAPSPNAWECHQVLWGRLLTASQARPSNSTDANAQSIPSQIQEAGLESAQESEATV